MKNLLYLLVCILLFSCSIQKKTNQNDVNTASISTGSDLAEIETSILNDFLDVELKKDRYKSSKDFEIVLIEEALKKSKAIDSYQYSYQEWVSMNNVDKIGDIENIYFLDTLQIKKIKIELEKEDIYHWKVSDFKNIKVSLLKYEELIKKINTNTLFNDSGRIVIYLSKPLMIDENYSLLSYEIDNCRYICNNITHFTVLMKKINNKWEENGYYYDGVFY